MPSTISGNERHWSVDQVLIFEEVFVEFMLDFADEIGAPKVIDEQGTYLEDDAILWAVQQPVSFASLLYDLAGRLGVAAPVTVQQAIGVR